MRSIFLIFVLNLLTVHSYSQISKGGLPISFGYKLNNKTEVFYTPEFDYAKMIEEDKTPSKSKPFRFGKTHAVKLNPENSGVWNELSNGIKIWQLEINSANAFSVGLLLDSFKLNKGVQLFVYSYDKKTIKGAFTSVNNKQNNKFSILPVSGDKIIVEIDVPANLDYGELNISGIIHDYKGFLSKEKDNTKLSGSCNVNINCSEGDDWQNEKRAVTKYIFSSHGSTYSCTGALVNNTAEDDKPYLLTANHCISTSAEAESATFIFNYESATCLGTTGSEVQSISVADLVVTDINKKLDFSLLQLSIDPPSEYNAYYAGWNRKTEAATSTVCIHHPSEDIKKISIDYDAPITGDYGEGFLENAHWQILEWDVGTTEGGSSGSPLFDQNHFIIGDLTGGEASCYYNYNDYYSKFDLSWDYYTDENMQLKKWLDPLNINPETINGKNQETPVQLDAKISYVNSPKGLYCGISSITPEIIIQNKGIDDLISLKISYNFTNKAVITLNWIGNLKTGEYETLPLNNSDVSIGESEFKVYCWLPNGSEDLNKINDTIISSFEVIDEASEIEILGDKRTCLSIDTAYYFVETSGDYDWNVIGGEIIQGENDKHINVVWEDLGDKKVILKYTNTCEQTLYDTIDVIKNEHSLSLNIKIEDENSEINYILKDIYGNIVLEFIDISTDKLFEKILCLESGCYELGVKSNSTITDYDLTDLMKNEVIVSESLNNNEFTVEFCLEHENNSISFIIYPNPSKQNITIEAKFNEMYDNASFLIVNLKGEQVIPEKKLEKIQEINISDLQRGYYLIKIKNKYGLFTKKIIKL
ncbi:MAG: T9SS type A sorting domain-containing protein [Bacteroidales bacterium]|nr:T9SS type A sorting domain-containing protein [Bacteroidales bacterium]MBN2757881.1 T9SS type A sorting domain-containing protein [Bacteroidales bacterium]